MTKGKKITIWILSIVLVIILGAVGGAYFYGNYLFNKLENIEIDKEDIGITEEIEEKLSKYNDSIINIALFGIDAVDGGVGRSDSIMIATLDTVHKNPLCLNQNFHLKFLLQVEVLQKHKHD